MADKTSPPLRILRRKQVEERTGLSRSTIYARINPKSPYYDPAFPKPVELGRGMQNPPVGWVEEELDTYLVAQVEKSRSLYLPISDAEKPQGKLR